MMRLPLVLPMFGVAVLLSGCANRLDTTTPAPTRTVTAAPPVYAPARTHTRTPATPRNITVVRTTSRPVARVVRVRPSTPSSTPATSVVTTRRVTSPKPVPCTDRVMFTPGQGLPFDPCDPCAGGRCSIPR